ncbi:MAG TPA: sialidase family protein [Accumulibacter sp.]|nr:sialidase family protein [Accumulibacter sp.]
MILSACANSPTTINGRNAPLTEIPDGQGVALAKMIAISSPSAFNAKWRNLILEDAAGKTFALRDVGPTFEKYSIFMGTLPEGHYQIRRLNSEGRGPGLILLLMSTDSANVESRLPEFDVRKDAITNLGTIVFQLPKGGDANSLRHVINDGDVGKKAALADLYPEDRTTLMSIAVSNPSDPKKAIDRIRETEALIAASPPFLYNLLPLADGRIAASGIAGFLHIRERDGTWHATHLNTFDSFTSLDELPDKTLALGTENGKYFLLLPDGKTVESHRLADPDLVVSAIIPLGRFGYAIRAIRKLRSNVYGPVSYLVLKKDDLHIDGTEKELASVDGLSALAPLPMYFHKNELFLFFNEPGFRRTTKMSRLNMATGERSQSEFPFWLLKVEPGSENQLVMTRMNGMSFYRSTSGDDGKTWQEIENELPIATFFLSKQLAFGLRKVSTGWDTVQMTLSKTEDGGKTWRDSGVPFTVSTGMPRLLGLGSREIVVFTGTDIRSTIDDGMTWKVEWPRK